MENMFVKRKISCDAMLQGAPSTLVLDHLDVAFKQSACYKLQSFFPKFVAAKNQWESKPQP